MLTSSKDWNVIIWDLLSESDPIQRHTTIRFDAPVISASFHPRNTYVISSYLYHFYISPFDSHIVLALLSTGEAYVVDLRRDYRGQVELCEVQDESDDEGEAQMSRPRCVNLDRSLAGMEYANKYGCLQVRYVCGSV